MMRIRQSEYCGYIYIILNRKEGCGGEPNIAYSSFNKYVYV